MFWLKISLLLITIHQVISQPSFLNQFLSIQIEYQSYSSYLPYIDTCYYNESIINSGSVAIEKLGSLQFYNNITYEQSLSFWGIVLSGFEMSILIQQNLEGNQGYILYNSKPQNLHRQVIFYNTSENQLNFTYVLPTINYQTLQMDITINNLTQVALTLQAQQILTNCINSTWTNFAFLGYKTFLYVCGSSKKGFTFEPDGNQSSIQLYNFQELGVIGDNYKVVSNPQLYDFIYDAKQLKYIFWNCLLLSQNGSQYELYYIDYDNNTNNLTLSTLDQRKLNQTLMMDRIWGFQQKSQVNKWMDVYSSLNISEELDIPGEIISVFVSTHNNIFVQTALEDGQNYLIVFDGEGTLYWNYSFKGSVIYYGSEVTFIYNQNQSSLYSASVQRPYIVFNSTQFPQNQTFPGGFSNFPLTIPCKYVNITVNYTIYWSTFQYPIFLIEVLDNSPLISTDSVYAIPSEQRFLVVGPGFQIKANSPSGINIQVIDSTTRIINDSAIGILNVETYSSGGFGIIIASNTTIYVVGLNDGVKILLYQPCGFNSITSGILIGLNVYQIINQDNQTCICIDNFSNCSIVTSNINFNNQPRSNIVVLNNGGQANQTILVKKNLYQIVNRGILGTILQNNTFLLINMKTREVMDTYTMNCSANLTNGIIFTREFYPPFLVLYCQGSANLYQFVIINNQINFKRILPLYGFKTRNGLESIRNALIYILIQVEIDTSTQQTYINISECCVLKLDFRLFTASVIQEIIQARTLVATSFYKNYDIALLQTQTSSGIQSIVKIYYLNQWFTFNYTNYDQIVAQNVIVPISLWSPFYNLGFFYSFNITFNLTEASLNLTNNFLKSQNITLSLQQNQNQKIYSALISYNFNDYVCGPIFSSIFTRQSSVGGDTLLIQDNILTRFKLISQPGVKFIQIINPQIWGVGNAFSFNNLLLFITVQSMYVYAKILNDVQLVYITNFTLPERSCTYTLYNISNATSVILNSDCYGIDMTFDTFLLTLNYDSNTNIFTSSPQFIQVSLALTRLQTIPFNSTTYLIAMIEGPMNAETGRLVICANITNLICTPLFVSTKYQFLIDYSIFITSNSLYFVMTIGPKNISVFIEPKISNPSNLIPPNFTFVYSGVLNQQFCSTIRILNVTGENSFVILTCNSYYYIIIMNFTDNQIYIGQKFARYSQCDLYDTVKPEVINIQGQGLQALFTQCRQNDYTLQLNLYDRTLNEQVIIQTGYLQIFLLAGPLGPNCSSDSISPVRIIPVSTSNNNPIFVTYRMNGFHKFIYAQLQGVLVDNFLAIQPQIQIIFKPRVSYYQFPTINFLVFNQLGILNQSIITQPQQQGNFSVNIRNYIIFIVFILANFLTLLFIISYFILREINNFNEDQQQELNDLKFEDLDIKPVSRRKRRKQLNKSMRESYQIQLFFIKKPVDQVVVGLDQVAVGLDQSMLTE